MPRVHQYCARRAALLGLSQGMYMWRDQLGLAYTLMVVSLLFETTVIINTLSKCMPDCLFRVSSQRLAIHGDYAGDILAEARSKLDASYCLQLLWFVHEYYDSQTVLYGADMQQSRIDLVAYMGQLYPIELVHLVCNELHVQFAANKLYATMQARVSVLIYFAYHTISNTIYSILACR
jgi:hypothetical protein